MYLVLLLVAVHFQSQGVKLSLVVLSAIYVFFVDFWRKSRYIIKEIIFNLQMLLTYWGSSYSLYVILLAFGDLMSKYSMKCKLLKKKLEKIHEIIASHKAK